MTRPTDVASIAGYLEVHARWAANQHSAYPEYLSELRSLHARLEQVTHRRRTPRRANTDCPACEGRVVRPVEDGLEVDGLRCQDCRTVWTDEQWQWQLKDETWKASWQERDGEWWATPDCLAVHLERSVQTMWSWKRRGQVRSRYVGSMVFLAVADAELRHVERPALAQRSRSVVA